MSGQQGFCTGMLWYEVRVKIGNVSIEVIKRLKINFPLFFVVKEDICVVYELRTRERYCMCSW